MKYFIKTKIRLMLLFFSLLSTSLIYAQTVSTTVQTFTGSDFGTTILVPINTTNITSTYGNIGIITIRLEYDTTVLQYVGFANTNASIVSSTLPINVNPHGLGGVIQFNIEALSTFSYPDGKSFDIQFIYKGGFSAISITNAEFLDEFWNTDYPQVINGSVSGFSNISASNGNWNSVGIWTGNLGSLTQPGPGHNVSILSGGTVTINSSSIVNSLTIVNGAALTVNTGDTLSVKGNFTIQDGGSFVNNGTGNNTASMERVIAKDNKWHFLSSPVGAQAITPGFAPSAMDVTFDFYKWDETISATTGLPWVNLRATPTTYNSAFETSFAVGRGYLVAYSSGYTGNATHSFTGTLANGDKGITIGFANNHFNLIGNPYPSAIDWDLVGVNAAATLGATPNICVWNGTTGNYGVYASGFGTNGVSNVIAPNQAFFVEALAAGTLTIPNASRVHGTQGFLKSTPSDFLKLKVSSTANTYSDEMIVNFNSNATANQGVAKWFSLESEAPSLYSVKNSSNLSINTLTGISNNLVVPVSFKAGVNGTYSIAASELNFTTSVYVYLKDLLTNNITDLNQNMFTFAASTNDDVNRFQLIFALSPLEISNNVIEHTSVYSFDNTIYVNSNEAVKQISIYNTLGQIIKTVENNNGKITINMNGYTNGYYIVKVVTTKNVYSEKVLVK